MGSILAVWYLEISDLFEIRSDGTGFKTVTKYVKIEDGYEEDLVNTDYQFMSNYKRLFDNKIRLKFPARQSLLACFPSRVR